MYLISTITSTTLLVLGAAVSASTELQSVYFTCGSSNASGFSPSCCTDINGQVGINCLAAHLSGVTNPTYNCNLFVYNITGCCQTIGYQNPYTNNTVSLCATDIDPI